MVKETHVMSAFRRGCLALLLVSAGACGAPAAPSSSGPATRIIALSGNLAFGNVRMGSQATATLTISNSGNSPLTVTGMTDSSVFKASWTKGTIPAGGSQQVTIQFAPTAEQAFAETLTVNGDQTSGTNTIAMSGTGFQITTQTFNWVPLDVGKLEFCSATSCRDFTASAVNSGTGCASDVWFHVVFFTQESGNAVPDALVPPVDSIPIQFVRPAEPFTYQTGEVSNPAGRHITGWLLTIHYTVAACQ
jgi:HYDIN/CFA65/VesB family protein